MQLPNAFDLRTRDGLIPLGELCEHLAMAIAAVEHHERKATVSLTFGVEYDEEQELLTVEAVVKSMRPVRSNRNEEILGDGEVVFKARREIPGQQRVEDASRPVGKDAAAGA